MRVLVSMQDSPTTLICVSIISMWNKVLNGAECHNKSSHFKIPSRLLFVRFSVGSNGTFSLEKIIL